MIVVAIISILTAIALPNYRQYVQRSERTGAIIALMKASNWLEQQFTINNSYMNGSANLALPIELSRSPESGEQKYQLTIFRASDTDYVLHASPTDPDSDDECGSFTLDQSGKRNLVNKYPGNGDLIVECWGAGGSSD